MSIYPPTGTLEIKNATLKIPVVDLQYTSNTAKLEANSNVVTEFSRSKKLIKYPRIIVNEPAKRGYVVSQSSELVPPNSTGSYQAYNIFDGELVFDGGTTNTPPNGTAWITMDSKYDGSGNPTGTAATTNVTGQSPLATPGEYFQLELPHKVKLSSIRVMGSTESVAVLAGRSPVDAVLAGSNDGTAWTTVLSYTGASWATLSEFKSFPANVDSTNAYKYFRFIITKNGGQGLGSIQAFEFYGTPEYDPDAHGTDVTVKSYPNVPNTDWLEVYYDAKNYTTGVVQDLSTNSFNGTLTNGASYNNSDGIDKFVFDAGTNQYMTTTTNISGSAFIHTTSMWVKFVEVSTDSNDQHYLFNLGAFGTNAIGMYYSANQGIRVAVTGFDYRSQYHPVAGRWFHVSYTYAGGAHGTAAMNTTVKFYINGQQWNIPAYYGNTSTITLPGSSVLQINGSAGNNNTLMDMEVANFRLFNRALTSDEIYQLYAYQKEDFGHGDLSMTLKAGRLGIGTSEPRVALDVRGNVIARGLREDAGRDYILGLAPNIWSVGGDSQDRITSGAINLGPHTFIQKVNGRSVWVMGAQDTYVDIMSTISTTDTTVTQAIALGIPMGVQKGGVLATQLNAGSSSGNVNHQIGYNLTKNIMYDNFAPSGGGQTTTSTLDMSKESILVVRRNGTGTGSLTLWYNGVKFEELTYSEIFSGTTPDRTRLGARDLVAVFNNTPIGLGFGAYAAWTRALTDNEIRYLTYDKMTSI